MKKVKDFDITKEMKLRELGRQYFESGGFVAKKVGTAINILKSMFAGEDVVKFLSFPACIVSTGTRGILKDLVKNRMFDIVITTCGTLDHDIARVSKPYLHGTFMADDKELHKKEINRLGNIFVPNESYGIILEDKMQEMLKKIYDKGNRKLSTHELVWELGKLVDDDSSIITWAYRNKIPIIIPGITDGAVGLQIAMFMQEHSDFQIDVFLDEKFLIEEMFGDIKSGAFMIGGGISKHHVIWWNQFKGGLDYAVYITTAPEWDGSLSGARVREGISWGKVSESAKFVTVEGDATVLLPLIAGQFL